MKVTKEGIEAIKAANPLAEVEQVRRAYYHGPALVDLQLLKAAVRRLKDEAFAAIRQEERRDAAEDQPGADRRYQGQGRPRITRR